jgi:two-component system OmpR family sensor kinase
MPDEFPDRLKWPLSGAAWIDVGWVLFSIANLVGMLVFPEWETVPFHFIWVSLTLLYGFRVWGVRWTMLTLCLVMLSTAAFILIDVERAAQPIDEITEVPLMAAMFLAMVWHARRRQSAVEQIRGLYEANSRLLGRERQFVQDASHELRTPITVALGHAELIERNATDEQTKEDARVVVDELTRLRRLADRLLVLAASEHPDFLHVRRLEVDAAILETLRRWTPVPRRWALGELDDVSVEADPDRLELAIDALIENAVKHTSPEDSITLSVERRDGLAVISVRDSGTGMPQAEVDRIFHRFARLDQGRSRNGGGTGLGLPIVKTVAEAHGGTVAVRSAPGRGSAFELVLPAATEDHVADSRIPRPPVETPG